MIMNESLYGYTKLINIMQEQFMLDGDAGLVLGTQVWFTLAEQLVLTVGVLVEALMLSAYLQTRNI